jgi:hypothetical protein
MIFQILVENRILLDNTSGFSRLQTFGPGPNSRGTGLMYSIAAPYEAMPDLIGDLCRQWRNAGRSTGKGMRSSRAGFNRSVWPWVTRWKT